MYDSLIHRDVFRDLDDISRRFDAWFGGRGLHGQHGLNHGSRRYFPNLQVDEQGDAFVLTADLPGVSADALEVSFEDGVLTLKGAPTPSDDEGWTAVRTERSRWAFERSVRFTSPVDGDGIVAKLTDGVLTVTVPRRQPTTITVTVDAA